MERGRLSLVIGGVRSGKSAYAQDYALRSTSDISQRAYVCTSSKIDSALKMRFSSLSYDNSRKFIVMNEEEDLSSVFDALTPQTSLVVIDNISVWIEKIIGRSDFEELVSLFIDRLEHVSCDVVIITSEVGMGVVPESGADREFRDCVGLLNQTLAAICDDAVLTVAGLPLLLKGNLL